MPIKIFFCYAHEDEALLNQLKRHLRPLQREGLIEVWHDRDITAGTEWEQEIDRHLNTADIILLLISPDFMDSDYCYSVEMKRALERQENAEARVIPILLRPVYWRGAPFGKLQVLPTDAIPITSPKWHTLDEAFFDVAEGVRKVITELLATGSQPCIPQPAIKTVTHRTPPETSITPGTVLYQADLSKPDNIYKEWQGMIFSGDAGWKISNGALLSSGNNTDETIWVQSVLPTANYAIEAQIQVLTLPDGRSYSDPAIGLLLRAQFEGHLGYFAKISGNFVLDTAKFSIIGYGDNINKSEAHYFVDLNPHTYRAEMRGTAIKLIIDTITIFEDTDTKNLFPSSGLGGLMTSLVPVKVTSFKIIAL